jgi:hypothetical protein
MNLKMYMNYAKNNSFLIISTFFQVPLFYNKIRCGGCPLDPMGKCSKAFFSETTNMIKAKLYMNVHWMVLYKL